MCVPEPTDGFDATKGDDLVIAHEWLDDAAMWHNAMAEPFPQEWAARIDAARLPRAVR